MSEWLTSWLITLALAACVLAYLGVELLIQSVIG